MARLQTKDEIRDSKAFYRMAKNRTPDEWVAAINTIQDPLQRNRVASKVWFDLSMRRSDLGPVGDMCLEWRRRNDHEDYPIDQLREGLIKVGFPESIAKKLDSTKHCKWKDLDDRKKIVTQRNGKMFMRPVKEVGVISST